MALLELKGVSRYFGGLAAVKQLDMEVHPGEILGLIGPNGAGKTTTFSVIAGELRPSDGRVLFENRDIGGWPTHRVARQGVVRSFQLNTLFPQLSVIENVLIGLHLYSRVSFFKVIFNTPSHRRREAELDRDALNILDFMGLRPFLFEPAVNLPHGMQRILGIAIALAAGPKLLLLDEPLTGMNPTEVAAMLGIIRRIRDELDTTIVVVEHNMKAVMALCERLVVVSFGVKIAQGPPAEIQAHPDVIEAYLGKEEHAA